MCVEYFSIGHLRTHAGGQVLLHDHQRDPRRTQILLRPGEDHAELAHIDDARHDIAGHVRNQRHAAGIREEMVLGTLDRVVAAHVHIGRVLVNLPLPDIADDREVRGLAIVNDLDVTKQLGLFDGGGGPRPRIRIEHRLAGHRQVHRNHGELQAGATLQKQHGIVVRNAHQFTGIGLGRVDDLLELLTAVTGLSQAVAQPVIVGEFRRHLLHDFPR
jgi:hypothetical protein